LSLKRKDGPLKGRLGFKKEDETAGLIADIE
jgi:hypothetical protein